MPSNKAAVGWNGYEGFPDQTVELGSSDKTDPGPELKIMQYAAPGPCVHRECPGHIPGVLSGGMFLNPGYNLDCYRCMLSVAMLC